MRNYTKEINQLTKERMKLGVRIRALNKELDEEWEVFQDTKRYMENLLYKRVIDKSEYNKYFCELFEPINIVNKKIDELVSRCWEIDSEIEKLRELRRIEYMRTSTYGSMDEIDICNKIHNNGFIIGVKF